MVPCHSCYIYGTWRTKEVWRGWFKVIISGKWVGQVTKWEVGVAIFMGKEELASLDTTKKIFVYLHCYQFNKTAAVLDHKINGSFLL